MAGWTTLSNSIKSIIKSNNNQEINGSNLQSVLLSIVNSLGGNAQFVDIATPETNPGYPDYNVFYLATEPGTYSNFDGLTVNKDEVVIFRNHISSKTWKKKAINLISIYSTVSFNRHVFTNSSEANRFIKELYVPNKEFSYLQGKTCSIDIQKASLHQSNGKYYNLFRLRIDGEDIGPDSNLVLISGSYETKEEAEAAINVGVNHTNLYSKDVYSVINWDAMETDSATIYNVVVNTLMWNLAMSPAIEYSISGVKESTEAANAAAQAALEAANATSNALSSINAATTVANNAKASADVAASSAVEATTKANNAAEAANNAAAEAAKATLAAKEATSSANELSNSLSDRVTNVESGIEGAVSIANSAMTKVDNVSGELANVKADATTAKTNSEQSLEKSNEAIQKVEENTNSITGISQKISGNINYEDLSESARQQIESAGGGSIVNNADDEDLEVFVNSGDKSVIRRKTIKQYAPSQKTGLGYVILRRNKSFIEQVIYSNTIYEIGYDFDLGGKTASIPANCILKFTGGSIDNGVLSSADSRGFIVKAEEYQIFGNLLTFDVNVSRTCIINKEVYAKWFGDMSETADSAIAIRRAIAAVGGSKFPFSYYPTIYLPATTIYLSSTVEIDSYGVIIDGRHERKNGLSPYIIPNVPNLTCFQVTGHCDCSFKNMLIQCPEPDETGVLRTFVAFNFIQAEHLYLDNCEVTNAKIGFYFSGTQNGINLALLNKISCTKSLYGVWINYGGDAAWKNGIEIVPWNISNNDINIRIDKGAVTTIRGGSAEIGGAGRDNTNLPSYISHNYGIYVTGESVVNVIGCLWLENLYYTIYAKDNSIVNVYGETWALSNFMKEDNANINIVGSNSQTVSLETGDLWRILKDKCGLFLDSNFLKSRDSTPGSNYNPTTYKLLNIKNFPEVEEPAECTAYTVNIGNKTFISSVKNYISNSYIGTRKITCFIKQRIGAVSLPIRFTTSSGKTLQIGLTSFTENSYNPPSIENNPDAPVVPCIEAILQIYYDGKFLQNSKLCRFFTKNSMASMKGGYFDLIIGISFDLDTYETMIINADGTSYIASNRHSMDIPQDEQIYINTLSIIGAYSSAKETGFEKIITFKDRLNSYEIDYVINRCLKENIFNTSNYATTFKNFEKFNPKVVSIPKANNNPPALLQTINLNDENNDAYLHGFIQANSLSDLTTVLRNYGGINNINPSNLLVFNKDSHRFSVFSEFNINSELMLTNVILSASSNFSNGEYTNTKYTKNGTVIFFSDMNLKAYVYNGAVYDFNGNKIRGTDYRKSGISSKRPTLSLTVGQMYFDTTLKKPIWYDGTAWVDSTGVYV